MERDILIGIDASLVNCGVAMLDAEGNWSLHTAELLDALAWLRARNIAQRAYIVIEDPNLNAPVFGVWGRAKAMVLKFAGKTGNYGIKIESATLADIESAWRMGMKQAQNVGESKAAAKILIKIFENQKIPVIRIAPSDRHRADKDGLKTKGVKMLSMPTKTTAKQFTELTGYTGRSNEHNRDAGTLIAGRNPKWAELMYQRQRK